MKTILILIFSLITLTTSFSQERNSSSLYLELGGNALLYSINYDKLISDDFGLRAGFMAFAAVGSSSAVVAVGVPVLANYFVGEGNHRLELGLGFTYMAGSVGVADVAAEGSGIMPTGSIAYRYQPVDGGFFFKVGFSPIKTEYEFLPWGGLGLGYTF